MSYEEEEGTEYTDRGGVTLWGGGGMKDAMTSERLAGKLMYEVQEGG